MCDSRLFPNCFSKAGCNPEILHLKPASQPHLSKPAQDCTDCNDFKHIHLAMFGLGSVYNQQ